MTTTRTAYTVAAAVLVGLLAAGSAALAGSVAAADLTIPITGIVRGQPGELVQTDGILIDDDLRGQRCDLNLRAANNPSEHPGTDIVVRLAPNGSPAEVTFPDVENEADAVLDLTATGTLGDRLSVWVRLGPDGVSSGGFTLTIECPPPATTTTTTPTSSTVPATTTTTTPTSSTVPPTVPPPAEPEPPTVTTPNFTG